MLDKHEYESKLITNKIQVIARRECLRKNNTPSFDVDPIRSKIRVFPIGRVPPTYSDSFFIRAGIESYNNNQIKALELLHLGQIHSINTFLYKFNHGVIMYKLGLLE